MIVKSFFGGKHLSFPQFINKGGVKQLKTLYKTLTIFFINNLQQKRFSETGERLPYKKQISQEKSTAFSGGAKTNFKGLFFHRLVGKIEVERPALKKFYQQRKLSIKQISRIDADI
jgi:hypothetical protein